MKRFNTMLAIGVAVVLGVGACGVEDDKTSAGTGPSHGQPTSTTVWVTP